MSPSTELIQAFRAYLDAIYNVAQSFRELQEAQRAYGRSLLARHRRRRGLA